MSKPVPTLPSDQCPVVNTKYGKVRGRLCVKPKHPDGKQVYNYQGVPYAKPPVGELRFEKPQEPDSWDGVLEATSSQPSPPQDMEAWKAVEASCVLFNELGEDQYAVSEDCLYLNVFTSKPSKIANMPVIVWIYGGGFTMGGNIFYSGNVLASMHDVVVVVPNWRVNVFGFLTFGKDSICPGNQGMYDQVMALKWVKDNIRNFGGNPHNVTLAGQSAGSGAVGYQMLSPVSKGLFHRAVCSSGASNQSSAYMMMNFDASKKQLFKELGMPEDEEDVNALKKLQQFTMEEILKAQEKILATGGFFCPGVDGEFLPDYPEQLYANPRDNIARIPVLMGFTSTEGSGMLMPAEGFGDGITEEACRQIVQGAVMMTGVKPEKLEEATNIIMECYLAPLDPEDPLRWSRIAGLVNGDSIFSRFMVELGNIYTEIGNDTYFYHFEYGPRFSHDASYGEGIKLKTELCESDHGDDLPFTFGMPFAQVPLYKKARFTKREEEVAADWMAYLANFATHGDPNKGESVRPEWPKYNWKQGPFLRFKPPSSEVGDGLIAERVAAWKKLETLSA